ncbi:DUF6056 family protein [Clostridium saccharoperbutylacetonicum]|uniref:DUF6056 family protein n=1 Tax=Clostridium saccharoperbutylacetonicum TaxID=36745 RepID=UPI0039EB2F95
MYFNERSNKKRYIYIIFSVVFFIAQCFITIYPGDDTYFIETVSKSKSIISFVIMRYETWGGRISSEFFIGIFSLLPLFIWRILNTMIAVSFVVFISKIIKLSISKDSFQKNGNIIDWFVCLSFFMIPISVTTRACSWFTGSFYYLWPTFFCLIAMSPFIYKIYNKDISKRHYIIAMLSVLYASYMEQTAAVLICFDIMTVLYLYKRDKKFYLGLVAENLLVLINLIIYTLSPGNELRNISETKTWYPTFGSLSLFQKVYQGVCWTHSHLVRETTILMLVISLLLFIIVFNRNSKWLVRISAFISSMYFIGSLTPINKMVLSTTSYEYPYDIQTILDKIFFNPMLDIVPAVISSVIIFSIIILMFMCIKNKNERYLCIIFYLAALSCGYILGFSPTIFASGPRIFFMTNILLLMIGGILLKNILEEIPINKMLWKISSIFYCSLASIYALIYVGGIAIKTIFKIN